MKKKKHTGIIFTIILAATIILGTAPVQAASPSAQQRLTDFLYNKKDLPEKAAMITFDDGYLDNVVFAYPILKKYGFTGIIFTITSAITETRESLAAYPLQCTAAPPLVVDDSHIANGNISVTIDKW